ncbi:hypothetical protein [Clostridium felsineum]|uniref:hypothetical protein n=1 Tax=Clostridium felsineum TaxID=36839 RepID=UPI00098CE4C2|nr:hypothetical protein [Clostridium felsineum]URZ17223.1 hypothetical protein CLFE_032760 [Clostridium felsineum DSM 794]
MKNLKLKALSLGIVSTVLISSSAFAATPAVIQNHPANNSLNTIKNNSNTPYVSSYNIIGYNDDVHFNPKTDSPYKMNSVHTDGTPNDVFYWAKDSSATVYIETLTVGYGAGNPYNTVDNSYDSPETVYSTFDTNRSYNLLRFINITQGYHTIKSALVNNAFDAPIKSFIPSINIRVSKLSAYALNGTVPKNVELTFKMPKKVDPNVNLYDYVGVCETNTSTPIMTLITLAPDGQTIIVDSSTRVYSSNTDYMLEINPGIKFTDGTESLESTLLEFVTNDTIQQPAANSFMNSKKYSSSSININSKNPLSTKNIRTNSNISLDNATKYFDNFKQKHHSK